MLKFYIVRENGISGEICEIKEFKTLKELWKYTGKNYIKEIKTLDEDERYSFHNLVTGEKVSG
jgi:hypothetical protein